MGKIMEDVEKLMPLTKIGTPAYASPQVYLDGKYTNKTDVYSLGVMFY